MTLNVRRRRSLLALALPLALFGALAAPLAASATEETYTVSEGDTLSEIAVTHGTTVEELVWLNGISNPDLIVTGVSLVLPAAPVAESAPSAEPDEWSDDDGAQEGGWVEEEAEDEWVWIDPPYVDQETIVALLIEAADMYGWDPALILAQAWQESRWRQDGVSHAGAIGVMQVLPGTAAEVGDWYLGREVDPWNSVWDNIESGVAFLTILYEETGSVEEALAAYYQGLGSLERDGWFTDTVEYVDLIFYYQSLILSGEF
jgi:soluble lytic murein transglycosylase-like protein